MIMLDKSLTSEFIIALMMSSIGRPERIVAAIFGPTPEI